MISKRFIIIMLFLATSGCASTSVFNPYTEQAANYRQAIANDNLSPAIQALNKKTTSADALLYLCEQGRLNQLAGNYAASKTDFEKAIARYQALDDRAKISVSQLGANASTLLTNDNAIPYEGYGYERIFVHHFQALNYLALGDMEGASVEIRRADLEQRILELAHEKEIIQAEHEASRKGVDLSTWQSSPELAGMDTLAGFVKNSFQNAYTFYTSAVLWEAQGNFNDALVDYKKALEINPDNQQILQDVKRTNLGQTLKSTEGAIVVLYEEGFVPKRQAFNLPIPYAFQDNVTYLTIAFPYYSAYQWPTAHPLTLYHDNHTLGQTQVIANVGAMAVKALKEKIPQMLVRQVLRAAAKHETNKVASDKGGIVGSLISTIYNVVSEQADLRSWLTLPANAQVLRVTLPAGDQDIELGMGGTSQTVTVPVHGGRITLLRIINADNQVYTETFPL